MCSNSLSHTPCKLTCTGTCNRLVCRTKRTTVSQGYTQIQLQLDSRWKVQFRSGNRMSDSLYLLVTNCDSFVDKEYSVLVESISLRCLWHTSCGFSLSYILQTDTCTLTAAPTPPSPQERYRAINEPSLCGNWPASPRSWDCVMNIFTEGVTVTMEVNDTFVSFFENNPDRISTAVIEWISETDLYLPTITILWRATLQDCHILFPIQLTFRRESNSTLFWITLTTP